VQQLKMAEKRKRVVLDLNQKIEIIKRLKKGETVTSIALIYGVGRTTVNDIKRDALTTLSHTEAETMLSKCIEWFEGQQETNATQILLLRKVRNIVAQKSRASKKQKKMTDYFKI
jgi:hypothetical protein